MKTLDEKLFFNKLFKKSSHNLTIEDRVSLGYKTYGIDNHAEFIDYVNPHDDCLWDALIPGYNFRMKGDTKYKSKKIIGMLWLSDGNHKIAVRIHKHGYNKNQAKKDINNYVNNYLKIFTKRKENSYGEWIELDGF